MKISDLGEFGLIKKISPDLEFGSGLIKGIGDDTAVLQVPGEKWVLMTTDMLVEEIHFSRRFASLEQIGWKAVAVNLSDIAAMGGTPTHATVSIGIPPMLEVEDVADIYKGIKRALKQFKVNVVGGDTVKCPSHLVINITLLGEIDKEKAVYRSGAKPGDLIFVTGPLGASAAGLNLFLQGDVQCPEDIGSSVKKAHLEPIPRLGQGMLLSKNDLASSMDDISDGLASELHEISEASKTGFIIDSTKIPISYQTRQVAEMYDEDPIDWALFGGEDFELVYTVNPRNTRKLKELFALNGFGFYEIGIVTESSNEFLLIGNSGKKIEVLPKGYNHFNDI